MTTSFTLIAFQRNCWHIPTVYYYKYIIYSDTTSEKLAIKKEVEPYFKALAKERQKKSQGRGKKGAKRSGIHSLPFTDRDNIEDQEDNEQNNDEDQGQVRDNIADYFGETGRQLEKEEKIVEAAQQDPKKFGEILEKVDSGNMSVDYAYKSINILHI